MFDYYVTKRINTIKNNYVNGPRSKFVDSVLLGVGLGGDPIMSVGI
jgi:hypothetical protein